MAEYYIGLLSGTSVDSIDAVIADFSNPSPKIVQSHSENIPHKLKQQLIQLTQPSQNEIHLMAECDYQLGELFALCVKNLLTKSTLNKNNIIAIGSHGQSIRHNPTNPLPYTIQIGNPNIITARTKINTISDFRRMDMANGGEGAPLTPLFHQKLFYNQNKNRIIANIGGITNITVLPKEKNTKLIGYDTGPGNTLLDQWAKKYINKNYDHHGQWAESGKLNKILLDYLLTDPYFIKSYPKSTGPEYFNLAWLEKKINKINSTISPNNIQNTLTELTAHTLIQNCQLFFNTDFELLLCGGGVNNNYLVERIQAYHKNTASTDDYGIDSQWLEALFFAWLAKMYCKKSPLDFSHITGANYPSVLGGCYQHSPK